MAKIPLIINWKPKAGDHTVISDGKLFIFKFDEVFEKARLERMVNTDNLIVLNKFYIKKGSYEKQLDVITQYINFFMKYYDEDEELAMAYLKLKYALDVKKYFGPDDSAQLIGFIYEILFSDTIVAKINTMVDDNYTRDIENSQGKEKYDSKENKHLESLEFTNKHIKILLRISFGMKLIAPILFHYIFINNIKLDKGSDLIFSFYEKLFSIFNEDVDMYNKLFVYVKAKVLESKSRNLAIWEQRDIGGVDEFTIITQYLKKVLISENMVKYKFNENIIGFNKTIIKYQLGFFLKEQYDRNITEVTHSKNSDGLSGMDKLGMNLQKLDEGIINLADLNIRTGIERIMKMINVDITEEEIQYHMIHHKPNNLQIQLVSSYFARFLGSYRDLNLVTRRQYIILVLLLKKKLLVESGYSQKNDENGLVEQVKLPYILTGNVADKVNTRLIRNNKFISKIEDSYLYQNLLERKYKYLHQVKENVILSLLSTFINTTFTYVAFEDKDLLGREIEYSEDRISDELLFFLNSI